MRFRANLNGCSATIMKDLDRQAVCRPSSRFDHPSGFVFPQEAGKKISKKWQNRLSDLTRGKGIAAGIGGSRQNSL